MIKTIVMTGDWMELPIDIGIEKSKIENRIIEKNCFDDGYASLYDEIAITADEDNLEPVLISDYTEDKQENSNGVADFIALKPRASMVLPRNKEISALNRPMVCGNAGDILKVVAR